MPSSPNGPCSAGNTTSAPSSPPPGRHARALARRGATRRRGRSPPTRPRGRRRAGRRARRRRRTATPRARRSARRRAPRRVSGRAARSAGGTRGASRRRRRRRRGCRGVVGVVVGVVVVVVVGVLSTPTVIVTGAALARVGAGARALLQHDCPPGGFAGRGAVTVLTVKPGRFERGRGEHLASCLRRSARSTSLGRLARPSGSPFRPRAADAAGRATATSTVPGRWRVVSLLGDRAHAPGRRC